MSHTFPLPRKSRFPTGGNPIFPTLDKKGELFRKGGDSRRLGKEAKREKAKRN
jgi:hypothetical protein